MRQRLSLILAAIWALDQPVSAAEVDKFAIPSAHGLELYWWPKLVPPRGWHHDQDQSYAISANALAPDGSDFAKAETVIYAKAIYKPRMTKQRNFDEWVADDQREFLKADPGVTIARRDDLSSQGGLIFQVYAFKPRSEPNWEGVAYAEDKDYYFTFVISSRSEAGYQANLGVFQTLVRSYR